MKREYYAQCYIVNIITNEIDIAWIPEKFAIRKKSLKIKINDEWQEGWVVEEIYQKIAYDLLQDIERDYLKQRKVSDI